MAEPDYDVVTVSDLRLPGGTAASIAEELAAQGAAGLRSGLVHVPSRLVSRQRPFNPRILRHVEAGIADVLVAPDPVTCDLLVLRHPTVLLDLDPVSIPPIRASRVILVANQSPGTPEGVITHYDPAAVARSVEAWIGQVPLWAPIGPLVRDNLRLIAPSLPVVEDDWVNVIDVDQWRGDRRASPSHPIMIGRHSRDHATKWPADSATVQAAYPTSPDFRIRVLGGARVPREIMGDSLPSNWTVHEFGELPPERFLAELDFFVYYHHPDWVEAFGRTILEALASGVVAVLPDHFRPLFGDACVYASPAEVETTIRTLASDPDRCHELSARGQDLARRRFSHEAHVARVAALLDRPVPPLIPAGRESAGTRILFVSSNGAGVGHLMRLMAMARRARHAEPLFLTLSQAVGVVHEQGYPVEYLPSRQYMGGASPPWHEYLRSRLAMMVDEHDIQAIVFDGTWPYQGLLDLPTERPGVRLIWSRRAMWKPGVTSPGLDEVHRFSLVVEPGEYAHDLDRGITRKLRSQVTAVTPITFLDREEQLERAVARAEMGLDPDRPAALIQLGAGNINDTSSLLGMVVTRLAKEPEVQICVTRSAIAAADAALDADVRQISVYPLARYLRAFDFAVAASGYNTYHELVGTPVPTLFVPNLETATDDQLARARFAEKVGVGHCLHEVTPEAVDAALTALLDPARRERMRERAGVRLPDNGADAAMAAIEELLRRDSEGPAALATSATDDQEGAGTAPAAGDAQPVTVGHAALRAPAGRPPAPAGWRVVAPKDLPRRLKRALAQAAATEAVRAVGRLPFRALPRPIQAAVRRRLRRWNRTKLRRVDQRLPIPSGPIEPQEGEQLVRVLLALDESIDGTELRSIVARVAGLQVAYRSFAPLFVTSSREAGVFRALSYLFEYLPAAETWPGTAETHARYLRARMADITMRFQPTVTVTLRAGDDPTALLAPLLRPTN
jgi:UDP:flavonoid glycosyltransferase YjiC (YdhE family)